MGKEVVVVGAVVLIQRGWDRKRVERVGTFWALLAFCVWCCCCGCQRWGTAHLFDSCLFWVLLGGFSGMWGLFSTSADIVLMRWTLCVSCRCSADTWFFLLGKLRSALGHLIGWFWGPLLRLARNCFNFLSLYHCVCLKLFFIVYTIVFVSEFLWRGDSECCFWVWFAFVEVRFSSFSFLLFSLLIELAPSCLLSNRDNFVYAIPYLVIRLCWISFICLGWLIICIIALFGKEHPLISVSHSDFDPYNSPFHLV